MNPVINKAHYLVRRELWENKGGVIWTPVVISIGISLLVLLVLALGKLQINGNERELTMALEWMEQQQQLNPPSDEPVQRIDFGSGQLELSNEDSGIGIGQWEGDPSSIVPRLQHGSVLAFEVVAFFVTFVYLLGALFNDRKDRSILFWKSLPISETGNVLTKLLFAVVAIPFIAIVCSIPLQIILGISAASIYSVSDAFTFFGVLGELELVQVLFIHIVLMLVIGIKSLPLFSWLLFSSAASKRTPLLMAVIVPVLIIAVESLLFGTSYLSGFIESLFFTNRFESSWMQSENLFRAALSILGFTFPQLIKIVIVSSLFIAGAIWCRNNRFEI